MSLKSIIKISAVYLTFQLTELRRDTRQWSPPTPHQRAVIPPGPGGNATPTWLALTQSLAFSSCSVIKSRLTGCGQVILLPSNRTFTTWAPWLEIREATIPRKPSAKLHIGKTLYTFCYTNIPTDPKARETLPDKRPWDKYGCLFWFCPPTYS